MGQLVSAQQGAVDGNAQSEERVEVSRRRAREGLWGVHMLACRGGEGVFGLAPFVSRQHWLASRLSLAVHEVTLCVVAVQTPK